MDIDKNFRKISRFREELDVRQTEEKSRRAKERLMNLIQKRFKTTFVGAISAFEEAFGEKWGDRLPESELNDEEYHNRKIWENVRNDIFNKGNNQMRAALSELEEYTVNKNDYVTNLKMKDKKEGGE